MSAPTKTATKQAAKKSVPSKTLPCPFKAAMAKGDHGGAINILLAKLDESNAIAQSLIEHIAKQDHVIMQYRGLTALAKGMGHL